MGKHTRLTIKQIYGADADLLTGYDAFAPIPRQVTRHLKHIELRPDEEFPHHRNHFSASERLLIRIALEFRFSVERAIPSVHILAEEADMCYQHACRCIRFLERQGLLIVTRVLGLANKIDISPLINRVRELLGKKSRVQAFASPPAQEEQEAAAPPPSPPPAADADRLDQLLKKAEWKFGELVGARQDAHGRLREAQRRAGWDDEKLEEKVEEAIRQAVKKARGRRFGFFFADLDRRAADAQFHRQQEAAWEEIRELEQEAQRALHQWDDQEPDLERYHALLDEIERKREQIPKIADVDANGRRYIS